MMCFFKHSDTSEFKMDLFSKERNVFFIIFTDIQLFLLGSLLMDSPFVASIQSSFTSSLLFWCRKYSLITDHLTSTTEKLRKFILRISDWSMLFSELSAGRRSTCTFICIALLRHFKLQLCLLPPSLAYGQSVGPKILLVLQSSALCISSKKFFSCLLNFFMKYLLFEFFDLLLLCVAFFCQNQYYIPYVQSLVLNKG